MGSKGLPLGAEAGIMIRLGETGLCVQSWRLTRAGRHRFSRRRKSLSRGEKDTGDVVCHCHLHAAASTAPELSGFHSASPRVEGWPGLADGSPRARSGLWRAGRHWGPSSSPLYILELGWRGHRHLLWGQTPDSGRTLNPHSLGRNGLAKMSLSQSEHTQVCTRAWEHTHAELRGPGSFHCSPFSSMSRFPFTPRWASPTDWCQTDGGKVRWFQGGMGGKVIADLEWGLGCRAVEGQWMASLSSW